MTHFLLRLVVSAVAVLVAQAVFPAYLAVGGFVDALIFALVLGLLNALVRPVLLLLTCPLNLVTLGLFTFVVNAVVFWLATLVPVGVQVDGLLGAFIGSLAVGLFGGLANVLLK